jgi:NADPH-dependent 7-cyano-7-deazaguanine reductase QueF-like protein
MSWLNGGGHKHVKVGKLVILAQKVKVGESKICIF